jgi:putative methylase
MIETYNTPRKIMVSPAKLGIYLSKLEGFVAPKIGREQYSTDPQVAAEIIHHATMLGDIEGRQVSDFGAGTGVLGLGCILMGARKVILIEQDQEALQQAQKNAEKVMNWVKKEGLGSPQIDFEHADIRSVSMKSETIIMNPPFGTKVAHADREFLLAAFERAPVIYVFAKTTTRVFIEKISADHKFRVTHAWRYNQYPLKATYEFHQKPRKHIDITVFRVKSESSPI